MRKLRLILGEALHLVRRNKAWFLFPILLRIALLVYSLGPMAMITFLYAGT